MMQMNGPAVAFFSSVFFGKLQSTQLCAVCIISLLYQSKFQQLRCKHSFIELGQKGFCDKPESFLKL